MYAGARMDDAGPAMRREVLIGVVAAAAGAGAAVLVAGSEQDPNPAGASAALAVVVGWSCVRVLAVVRFLDAR